MTAWADFISNTGMLIVAVIAIFEGTRRIASDRITKPRVLVVGGVIVLFALFSALQFYVSTVDSLKYVPKEVGELAADWGKELSPTQKEQVSSMRASIIYTSTGNLVDYVDTAGARKKYAPSQTELKERESIVLLHQQLDALSQNAYNNGFRSLLFPLFALLMGWIIGREQQHVTANQSLQDGRQRAAELRR